MNGTKLAGLRLTALSMLLLLVAQFVAGIVANLYVTIPATIPGTGPGQSGQVLRDIGWALAHGALDLRIHVGVALLLVAASLVMAGFGIATRRAAWVVSTLVGAVMIVTAAEGGIGFLAAGGHNFDSLLMALGFMGAFIAYGAGFYLTQGR
jgi:hypothetical protein